MGAQEQGERVGREYQKAAEVGFETASHSLGEINRGWPHALFRYRWRWHLPQANWGLQVRRTTLKDPFDEHGRILVTSEALARVMRSA